MFQESSELSRYVTGEKTLPRILSPPRLNKPNSVPAVCPMMHYSNIYSYLHTLRILGKTFEWKSRYLMPCTPGEFTALLFENGISAPRISRSRRLPIPFKFLTDKAFLDFLAARAARIRPDSASIETQIGIVQFQYARLSYQSNPEPYKEKVVSNVPLM